MSNIDKQALNQEKIEWLNKLADMEYCKSNPGHWLMSLKDTNMLAKLALRSVSLLDELEAKDKRIVDLEARTLVPVEPTLDQLVAGKRRLTSTGRMSRLMSQRLAEVYRAMVSAAAAGKGE